jgi:hypothetical protein
MPRRVSRTEINFLLDSILLLLFVAVCTCAVILQFVFPTEKQEGWLLWSRSFSDWSRYQFTLIAAMALAVLLHVMLHWSWICGVVTSRFGDKAARKNAANDDPNRTLWGVGLLIVIVNVAGAIVAAAALTIQSPPGIR